MSRKIAAKIRFLPHEEGGFSRPPLPGVRPQLRLGDVFTSCIVCPKKQLERFEQGMDHDVILEVMFWDRYKELMPKDLSVRLYDGSRLVATGVFLEQ